MICFPLVLSSISERHYLCNVIVVPTSCWWPSCCFVAYLKFWIFFCTPFLIDANIELYCMWEQVKPFGGWDNWSELLDKHWAKQEQFRMFWKIKKPLTTPTRQWWALWGLWRKPKKQQTVTSQITFTTQGWRYHHPRNTNARPRYENCSLAVRVRRSEVWRKKKDLLMIQYMQAHLSGTMETVSWLGFVLLLLEWASQYSWMA